MAPKKLPPSPKSLLLEAKGVEEKVSLNLYDYADVIGELRGKNYSYGKIAAWLAERIGVTVNKGLVFRIYEEWAIERAKTADDELYDRMHDGPPTEEEEVGRMLNEDLQKITFFMDENFPNNSRPYSKETLLSAAVTYYERVAQDEERAAKMDEETEGETK